MKYFKHGEYAINPDGNVFVRTGVQLTCIYNEIENRIAKIIEKTTDLSILSAELRVHCVDFPSMYHLGAVRANIIRPFESVIKGDVLEIGAGCGALSRYLGEQGANVLAIESDFGRAKIARARTHDLTNVNILVEHFDQFQCDFLFDVICVISDQESADLFVTTDSVSPPHNLTKIRSLLKPNGIFILAIDNPLGLKYFAGAQHACIGKDIFETDIRDNDVNSYTTRGLAASRKCLAIAGFSELNVLSPFPDHRLPVSILTEAGIASNDFDASAFPWLSSRRDMLLPEFLSFSPELIWPQIFDAELGLYLSNSFLIAASPTKKELVGNSILAFHYTTDRVANFCKESIFKRNTSNEICINYRLLSHELKLNAFSKNKLIDFVCPDSDKYIYGKLLLLEFIHASTNDNGGLDKIALLVGRYVRIIEDFAKVKDKYIILKSPYDLLPGEFYDAMPSNIIVEKNGQVHLIDKEWRLCEKIELGYILFRALLGLVNLVTRFSKSVVHNNMTRYQFIDRVLKKSGFELEERDYKRYIDLDANIQEYVTARPAVDFLGWGESQLLPFLTSSEIITNLSTEISGFKQTISERSAAIGNLEQTISELNTKVALINASATWRISNRIRSFLPDVARRQLRRVVKAMYWVVTPHRMPERIKFLRARHQSQAIVNSDLVVNNENLTNIVSERRVTAVAPTQEDWKTLIESHHRKVAPVVDIIIPVYGGYDETMRCIYSVLTSSSLASYNLLVINDHSPDTSICDGLKELSDCGLFELHHFAENRGFIGACNYAMSIHSNQDVVLLNSDTAVYADWLDRILETAYADPRIATVTPFSNNAEICSYPNFVQDNWKRLEIDDLTLDRLAAEANKNLTIEIPTGVGFCMFVRRTCLNEIGLFDFETFGKGYGEENDLCRRATEAGWKNILAPNVFVRHYGGVSFAASKLARIAKAVENVERLHPGYLKEVGKFIGEDPALSFRRNIDTARIKLHTMEGTILFVLHSWGGGTEAHVKDLCELLESQGIKSLICMTDSNSPNHIKITSPLCDETPNLPSYDIQRELHQFVDALHEYNVKHIHIHHLADFSHSAADFFRIAAQNANLGYDVTIHDYMPICPRINLVDESGVYCGEPIIASCESCITQNGSHFGNPSVWEWRDRYSRLLSKARRVFVPNSDVKNRMSLYFPKIDFLVRIHPELSNRYQKMKKADVTKTIYSTKFKKKIALLGAIGPHKGSDVLEAVVRSVKKFNIPLEFVVVGYTDRDPVLRELGVEITGRYDRGQEVEILSSINADMLWFSSVWPETYSYTLSAALAVPIYPVAFDMGAIAVRLREKEWGTLLPLKLMTSPDLLAQTFSEIEISAAPSNLIVGDEFPIFQNFFRSYYETNAIF